MSYKSVQMRQRKSEHYGKPGGKTNDNKEKKE